MRKKYNAIMIVIDCLRYDYADELKNLLARYDFLSYENVIAPAPWTTPSITSMLTGLYPIIHGVHEARDKKLLKIFPRGALKDRLITNLFLKHGFRTYLLTANPLIHPKRGFKGFSKVLTCNFGNVMTVLNKKDRQIIQKIYKDITEENAYLKKLKLIEQIVLRRNYQLFLKLFINMTIRRLSRVSKGFPKDKGVSTILNSFKKVLMQNDKPSFFYIHLMETHEPYLMREYDKWLINFHLVNISQKYVSLIRKKYLEEVRYVTKKVKELLEFLDEKNRLDDSLIVILGDHGQLLGEHGKFGHGTFLYDELLRVPLLVKYPKSIEIQRTTPTVEKRYISLIKMRALFQRLIKNDLSSDNFLYSTVVFSESYGTHENVSSLLKTIQHSDIRKLIQKIINHLEKHRIAIYYDDFRGEFNVNDGIFEKIESYNGKDIDKEEISKLLKRDVLKLVRIGSKIAYARQKLLRRKYLK